jgi:phosphohistidine phosphatase
MWTADTTRWAHESADAVTTESATRTRNLLLLRHGHAHAGDGSGDRDRHLDKRGRRESKAAGLAARSWVPDLALVSESVRTRETFDRFCRGLDHTLDVRYLDELYQADVSTLRRVVSTSPTEVSTVLLVGHNPPVSELCAELIAVGESVLDASRLTVDGMRTGMLAVFTWTGDWDPAVADGVRLEAVSWAGDRQS